ncbi:MAG TPA: ABC transporter substrate-binding protein, partial [Anaerolineales bacterium]|nr:ABC transporter substrate-binding protein [Anaerolineales bacterium]
IADPGSRVAVNIWSQNGLARYVTTDTNGNWVADFSVFGDEDFEQFTTDLTYGDNGRAIQLNPDGTDDGTLEYWNIDWIAPDTVPLVAAISGDVDLNRPAYTTESWVTLSLLYEPFYRLSDDGTLIPAAATGYTVSTDGLVYTVTLRNDMFWSDGQPVTAQQYADGLLRILHPDTATDYASLLFDIQGAEEFNNGSITDPNLVGITALNSTTLQITLKHPAVYFPQILAIPGLIPARLDLINQFGDAWTDPSHFAANGPYTLLEHDGGHFLLQRNPGYYNAAGVTFEQVGLDIIPDENERFEAYKRGEVDVLIDAPQSALDDLSYAAERIYSMQPGVSYIGLNTQRAPTDNPLVRRALAAAIDRRTLLDTVLNTPWRQEATGVVPPELPGYQGSEVGYEYNPTLAQDLLAQAGYPGGVGLPTIHLYGSAQVQPMLDAIADQWRTVLGISVETHYPSDLLALLRGCQADPASCEYNAYRLGWIIDYFDTHNLINDGLNPDSGWISSTGWDNARYRELIDLSRGEQNQAQRIAYFQEAERILVEDDTALIPVFFYDRVSLVKPGFSTAFGLIPYFEQWGVAACYSLATSANPVEGGNITTDPAPNCPTEAGKYLAGTQVTLTAHPNAAWSFTGWSGDVTSTDDPVQVTMDGDKSATATFTAIPVLLAPEGALSSWDNIFHWTGIASADYYQLEVYDASDVLIYSQWFTTGICTSLDCAVSPMETRNLPNGDYKWKVRTYGSPGYGPWTAFTSFSLDLQAVMLIAPNGTLSTWNNTFNWTGVSSADFYFLEVYDASDTMIHGQWFTTSICSGLDCTVLPAETRNLANGDYKWRIQTYGANGFGPYTDFMNFSIDVAEVTLLSPAGTLSTWDNIFQWTGISGADYYQLEVYDAGDVLVYGQWYTNGICSGLDCSVSPAETLNLVNGDYKWRVQTYGSSGYGPWTALTPFKLSVIRLGEPSGTLTTWDNTFRWTGLSTADFYRLQVYEATDETLLYDQWFTTSICSGLDCVVAAAETQDLGDGDYKWRVQTYGSVGYSDWSAFQNFSLDFAAVELISPNGSLSNWDNTFYWTGIAGADFYLLEVYDASDTLIHTQWFTTSVCAGLDCSVSPAETLDLGNGDYQWRVQTYGATGFGPYTEFMNFTLDVAGVTLISPNGTLATWNNTFHWTGISGADFYFLEVYDATTNTLIHGQWFTTSICSGLDCSVSPAETLNLANSDYQWRVQTYGASGFGPYTEFMNFTLNTPTVILISPSGTLGSWSNTFHWTGVSSADFYFLEVYDASDTMIHGQWFTTSICSGLDCSVSPVETLNLATGDYKWRVQTYGATGFGPYTEFMHFTLQQ